MTLPRPQECVGVTERGFSKRASMCMPCVRSHMRAHCRLCSSCARLQICSCKSICVCVILRGDTTASTLQLVWPQGYAALSFSGAPHLWQLSWTCSALPEDVGGSTLLNNAWVVSGKIVWLSLAKCHLSAQSVIVFKAEVCTSREDESDLKWVDEERPRRLYCGEKWSFFTYLNLKCSAWTLLKPLI